MRAASQPGFRARKRAATVNRDVVNPEKPTCSTLTNPALVMIST
jgi:hypothetical protein